VTRERLFEIVRFGIVGVAATAIHYAVYYALLSLTSHNVAYTVGYVVSFLCNYVLSSLFTFRVTISAGRLAAFGVSHLLNYLIQMGLLNLFVWTGVSPVVAPLPVFAIAVPVNYLLVRTALTRLWGK